MNRVLKRPMFRIGGSAGTGITSGLDRKPFQRGSDPTTMIPQLGSLPRNTSTVVNRPVPEERGVGLGPGTLPGFLTQFGLNLASATPRGNIFATAASAAQEPFQTFQQAKFAEAQSEREFEREKELQLLKNLDESSSNAIEQEIQARMTDLGETREEASRIVLDKRAYGVLDQPGEVRQKAIDERSAVIQNQERLSKPAADQKALFEVDFSKIQKDNEEYDFDIMDPFWTPERKNYQEGSVYIDYVTGKAFRRDSTQTQNTPIGFVEVPLK
jgi:hypothetical protein